MGKLFAALCLLTLCITVVSPSFAAKKQAPAPAPAKAATKVVRPIAPEELGEYHAILIGINGYKSLNKLKTPVKDVEALADILKNQYGFSDVVTLTDETKDKPTGTNILKYIREKAGSLTDKDNLLVYYAGHGSLDKLTSAGYWIPINGEANDTATWISHDQIKSLLETKNIVVKNFLLVADSCYSGSGTRSIVVYKGMDDDAIQQERLGRGIKKSREVITSGGVEPVEDVVPGSDNSLFAHYFLKALRENDNRYIDMQTLLHEKVIPEINKWGKQKPEVVRVRTAADDDGLFVMAKTGAKSHKASLQEELDRLIKENEGLKRLREHNKSLKSELDKAKKNQQQVEEELSSLKTTQSKLLDEKKKLDETDRKNKEDAEKNQAILNEKDKLSSAKVAEAEKEKQRIAALNQRIEQDRASLSNKERSVTESEAKLRKQKNDLNDKIKEQQEMSEILERRKKELDEKDKILTAKAKSEEERLRKTSLEANAAAAKAEAAAREAKKNEEQAKAAELRTKNEEQRAEAARQNALRAEEQARLAKLEKEKAEEDLAKAQKAVEQLGRDQVVISGSEEGNAWQSRFIVKDTVVLDTASNLMWVADANAAEFGKNYEEAEKYLADASFAGYNGWRIPNNEDWLTLIPKGVKGIKKAFPGGYPFKNVVIVGNYWIAPTLTGSSGINLGNGSMTRLKKNNPAYVWPVRYATPEEIFKFKTGASILAGRTASKAGEKKPDVKEGKRKSDERVVAQVNTEGDPAARKALEAAIKEKAAAEEALLKSRKDNEALQTALAAAKEKQKKVEDELSRLSAKQLQISDERRKLNAIEQQNKDDERKLKQELDKKEQLTEGKIAENAKEQQRIAALNKQILNDRNNLSAKERSITESEALLRKQQTELLAKTEEQRLTADTLERRNKELEEKEKYLNERATKLAEQTKKEGDRAAAAARQALEAAAKEKAAADEALKLSQKQNEQLQKELAAAKNKQKKVEDELGRVSETQRQLSDERRKLDAIDQQNKEDALKLKRELENKEQMTAEQLAVITKEKQRIAALDSQILNDRNNMIEKERSLAESEALLRKQQDKLLAKSEEQRKMADALELRKQELEKKEQYLAEQAKGEEERARIAAQKAREALEQAQFAKDKAIEEEKRADAAVKRAKEAAGFISESAMKSDVSDRFIVRDNVVFDKETKLMWMVDANVAGSGKNYETAENYVSSTPIAGYNDWRIPTNEEWRSLIPNNVKGINKAFPNGYPFKNIIIRGNYWASSKITGVSGINLGNGSINRLNKKNSAYIWPVREPTPDEILKISTEGAGGSK